MLNNSKTHIYVAKDDEQIIGICAIETLRPNDWNEMGTQSRRYNLIKDKVNKINEIITFALVEKYRNLKIGQTLFDFALKNIKTCNSFPITLSVEKSNYNAIHIYEKYNFERFDEFVYDTKYNDFKVNEQGDVIGEIVELIPETEYCMILH